MAPILPSEWIAFLDADEEDFLFWQFGFKKWANTIELQWFPSAQAFLSVVHQNERKPRAMILDGIVPHGEERDWLTTFLSHACCQHIPIYLLAAEYNPDEQKDYIDLGATEYLTKPNTTVELEQIVQKVIGCLDV
ncbi:hypothetical protein [Spirosoma gilvum]